MRANVLFATESNNRAHVAPSYGPSGRTSLNALTPAEMERLLKMDNEEPTKGIIVCSIPFMGS